jgi:hypothetical protein
MRVLVVCAAKGLNRKTKEFLTTVVGLEDMSSVEFVLVGQMAACTAEHPNCHTCKMELIGTPWPQVCPDLGVIGGYDLVVDEYCPVLGDTNVMTLENLDRIIALLRARDSLLVVPRDNTDYTLHVQGVHVMTPQDECPMPSMHFVCIKRDRLRVIAELLHQTDRSVWGTQVIAHYTWPGGVFSAKWLDVDGDDASSVSYTYSYDED